MPAFPPTPSIPSLPEITFDNDSTPTYPKITISGPTLLLPGNPLPITFTFPEIDINPILGLIGVPPIPAEIGTGPFDVGIKLTFVCPGFPLCGAKQACTTVKNAAYHVNPSDVIGGKIPGTPPIPKVPVVPGFTVSFPPKFMLPLRCPNYIRQQQQQQDGG